jgi:hypothetical protein
VYKFLTEYYEPVWVGARQGLHNRAPPTISHARWNHFFDCVSGDGFTNNSSEGKFPFFLFSQFLIRMNLSYSFDDVKNNVININYGCI